MIIDSIKHIDTYKDLKIYSVLSFIANTNFNNLALGKHYLDGENLFFSISEFNTKSAQEAIWESHYKYTDVHVMLNGQETIAVEDTEYLKANILSQDQAADLIVYQSPIVNPYVLKPGMFAVMFTNNGHMPNLMVHNKPQFVKKVIFKVDLKAFNLKQ